MLIHMAACVSVTRPLKGQIHADQDTAPSTWYILHGMERINVIMNIKLGLLKTQIVIVVELLVFILVHSDIPQ